MITLKRAKEVLRLQIVTKDTVEAAFKARRQETHPDKGGSAADFAEVYEAYELLKGVKSDGTYGSAWSGRTPFKSTQEVDVLESKFQAEVVAAWEGIGAKVFNVHGHAMQKAGWPDLQVYSPHWTGHLELKVGDNKPSTLQALVIRDLKQRGTAAFVLRWAAGEVWIETETGEKLYKLDAAVWSQRQGNQRGWSLVELCKHATAELNRYGGGRAENQKE